MIPLPAEIFFHILDRLPRSDVGARTLSRCIMAGNCLLREVAMDEDFWKEIYDNRYKHADSTHEAERRRRSGGSWRVMYAERRKTDYTALERLKAMEKAITSDEQTKLAAMIVESRFDVWDALTVEASQALRPPLLTAEDVQKLLKGAPLTNLTRRYWASELLKVIARRNAIDVWETLRTSDSLQTTFEEAFATLSSFHGILPDVVRSPRLEPGLY